jgi:membrane-bound serine protease (ClpP class)
MQIGLRLISPVTVAIAGILLFLVTLAVNAQRTPPVTGASGMVDEIGTALTAIESGGVGRVRAHGEIWKAIADGPVAEGAPVRIIAVDGLQLRVSPVTPAASR